MSLKSKHRKIMNGIKRNASYFRSYPGLEHLAIAADRVNDYAEEMKYIKNFQGRKTKTPKWESQGLPF